MNFRDLQLNEHLKNSLNALDRENRMPHAFIISGGSEESRRALCDHMAAWAVCSGSDRPCGSCKNCQNAFERAHSDIHYAKGSGKTKIYNADELKWIVGDASIKPNQADRKVYIFEECDKKLPVISQNIMLKTIEEPPQDILFLLTCENSKTLLETIRSRATVLTLGDEKEPNAEAAELAEEILIAAIASSELELLKIARKLSDRFTALETLDCMVMILGDGLCLQAGGRSESNIVVAERLSVKLTRAQLLQLIEITLSAQEKINQNVSMELLSTWLCSKFRDVL